MTNQRLRSFSWTDQGCAEALIALYGADLRFCREQEAWYRWDGKLWGQITHGEIRQLAVRTAQRLREAWADPELDQELALKAQKFYKQGENKTRCTAAAQMAADMPAMHVSITQFNEDRMLLGVENGYIDLRDGSFHRPDRLKYMTMKANVHFDPRAECPLWEKFVSDIYGGDDGVVDFVQRADGYNLTGLTDEQLMFMCIGDGANGKSTYLNVKRDMLGDYSKAAPFTTFSAKNRSEMSNDLARLMGARYVTIIESDEDACLAEAKIKQATGGDPIPCRFLHQEYFEYTPQFKIWMAANRLPIIKGTDHGNFRRMIVLPFNRRFTEAERIPDMQDRLFAERSGILNWMLKGLAKWRKHKLIERMPEALLTSKADYQDDMDITGKWLAARVQKSNAETWIYSDDLYADYHQYIKSIGHFPKSSTLWGREMKTKHSWRRVGRGVQYKGLSIAEAEWPSTLPMEVSNVK